MASSGASAAPGAPAALGSSASRVIFIRGPPACGKSTVTAAVLASLRKRGNRVVHLDMDHFRLRIVHSGPGGEVAAAMLGASARAALACGFDVVMDGLLSKRTFGSMIEGLCEEVGKERVGLFHLDVSVEEAQRRHAGRPHDADFTPEKLAAWFSSGAALGHAWERQIPSGTSVEAATEIILAACSPAPPADGAAAVAGAGSK